MSDIESVKTNISLGKARENCVFKGNYYRITILSNNLIRLEYNENGIFNDYPTIFATNRYFKKMPSFSVKEDSKFLNITTDLFVLEYSKEKPYESSKLLPDSNFRITIKSTNKQWYYNNPEVKNLRGTTFSFDYSKNFSLSKGLYNLDGFASFDDSNRPIIDKDGFIKKNPSDSLDMYLFIYENFNAALDSYFELTGYPALLPRYAFGVWWNKNEDYNAVTLMDVVNSFNKENMPISSVLLGDKYRKNNTNFEIDNIKFPNFKETINELHRRNIHFGLTIKPGEGVKEFDKSYSQNFVKDMPINVYNSEAVNIFLTKIIDELTKLGVDYFLIDDILEDKTLLFLYIYYIFNNYLKDTSRRNFIVSRNAGISAHRYAVLYSGKTEISWRTLNYLPEFNITSSNIGLSYWSHDIGGYYSGVEDSELYIRYVQLGCFSPIFRFSSKEGHYYKREPWMWDDNTKNIALSYIRLRANLIPYLYSESYKYSNNGKLLITPIYYSHNELIDEPIYKNEYYLGSGFLVSPITEAKDKVMNRVLKRLYLPSGMWYDFKTGKKFPGNKRYITFYKDADYPVFVKSGAIIPLAVTNDENINDTNPPKKLEIHIFPGNSNSYNLYEDDGITDAYKAGYYIVTNIDYNYRQNNYTLIIRSVEGKYGIIPDTRDYKIRFRNTKIAENVKVSLGNKIIDRKTYTENNDFIIEVNDVNIKEQLTIICEGKAIEIEASRIINDDIDSIISDLQIETSLKEKVASIIFSDKDISKKRIEIRKLKSHGLNSLFVKMFLKLLEYINEV